MKVMFIGDIVGNTGRKAVKLLLPSLKQKYNPHIIIANAENAAGGRGVTAAIIKEFADLGIHGFTMGNHTWDNKDIFEWIDDEKRLVRPANFPPGTPGQGYASIKVNGKELVIVNLQGRTFLPAIDCPFRKADEILESLGKKRKAVLVDFHAEATSEKIAMGWHLDGRASLVVGTHTHVQTNDDTILPQGTAYLTDVGMVGSKEGVLGMEREAVLRKFKTQLPVRFVVDEGKWQFHAVVVDIDEATGLAVKMEKVRVREDDWIMS
ncbi:TIGR00282 family metallophosphoesterase [Paenibacillus apiarius]|uniref:TIGR00282 family metallophosphoesterase n=1 Tax=Paenibacillus apiarius TaxID=46240 RepID=A0ABT4DNV6_9BACL|nr:TIGR00282 family metallophosphoesterase [Paenibacillus apiarius]MCY9516096.1 TIGR00282 family metallophosphoesterase [Paenibacillus apiarius]MCY9518445.1 TIGR00282 family metallophosphoesterase [Paenibacillus apiarius]MCY9551154.1 TIGR00282 family metallophosphoesterase [Paenibacillus apiarius]MCY9558308.1 TIGR00282 family metallophosphoesterase [Paenibacillus apiarius]MCY9684708.1 TIGR00282 family metallophosphoesterase [Paenibacillus apiarius]